MKQKLFFLIAIFSYSLLFSQFSTGTVSLPETGMTVKIDTNLTTVTLTLTGSSNSWLGIGFNASGMGDTPDAFIYNSSASRDYKINGYITPSADSSQDWTVTTNNINSGTRTVVATRSLTGGTGDYAFTNASGSIDIIYAIGPSTLNLTKHSSKGATTLNFSNLGVDDISKIKESFKISQNPVKNNLEFRISANVKSAKIYDISGKQVKSTNESVNNLNVSDLQSGIYFLEIETKDKGSFFEKFIKE